MKIKASLLSLALLAGTTAGVYAATCTTIIDKPDGTRILVEVEGDTCSMDWNSGVCQCS